MGCGSLPVDEGAPEGAVVQEHVGVAKLGVEAHLHLRHAAQHRLAVLVPEYEDAKHMSAAVRAERSLVLAAQTCHPASELLDMATETIRQVLRLRAFASPVSLLVMGNVGDVTWPPPGWQP